MDYEDMVDEVAEAQGDEVSMAVVEKSGMPWKAVVLTGCLSGLIGTAGGAALVYFGLKSQSQDVSTLQADFRSDWSKDMRALEMRLSAAEAAIDKKIETALPLRDLSSIEDRLSSLESERSAEISAETLEALKAAEDDGFDWPDTSALEDRLIKLETRPNNTEAIFARLDRLENMMESPALPEGLLARIDALENRPPAPAQVELVSIPPLPKMAMLDAIDETGSAGLLQRTLSKHIRVKDDDAPRKLVADIEDYVRSGRLDLAIKTFERLPEPVQAAGQDWFNATKRANEKVMK